MTMALDAHAIAVLVLTAFAFVLFARDDLPIETSSLLIVTLLAAGFILFPYETAKGLLEPADFFLGFGNLAVLTAFARGGKASVIAPLGSLYPVVSVPIAVMVLGESVGRRETIGILFALVSVVALAMETPTTATLPLNPK